MYDRRPIALRSDTITQPTRAMREAMADAEVGDDVFGDDPTGHRLEARVAGMLGKEAALFTPSGTMANPLAVRAHTEPGDEILVEANAHVYFYETGGPAALSGVSCRCLSGLRGVVCRSAEFCRGSVFPERHGHENAFSSASFAFRRPHRPGRSLAALRKGQAQRPSAK